MFNDNSIPRQGCLLLAEPFMSDSTFERAVVLLCEHDEEGTLGLILNKPTHLLLSDIIEDLKEKEEFPIFIGGPVESGILFFVHCAFDKLHSGTHILDNIYWGGDFDRLLLLIKENLIHSHEVKFFLGYSGWSPQQLLDELKLNSWAIDTKYDCDLIFLTEGEDLWKKAVISLGPKYAHVANFPKSPDLN